MMTKPSQTEIEEALLPKTRGRMRARTELWKDFPGINHEQRLWILLAQTSNTILRARGMELYDKGVGIMEYGILMIVSFIGPDATPGRIAQMLGRTPHSTSGLLSRMEKGGLVRKVKNPENKRMVRIEITDKGKEVYGKVRGAESINRIMSVLPKSKTKRRDFEEILLALEEAALREVGLVLASRY